MSRLGAITEKIRSKNAGPFWLTIDIFCGNSDVFSQVSAGLETTRVARLYATDPKLMKRFDISKSTFYRLLGENKS